MRGRPAGHILQTANELDVGLLGASCQGEWDREQQQFLCRGMGSS